MNQQTPTFLTAAILAFAAPAVAFAETSDYSNLGAFTAVSASAGVTVEISRNAEHSVVANAESATALGHLDIHLEGQTLVITRDSNLLDFILEGGIVGALFGSQPDVTITVQLPVLESVHASSGSDVDVNAFELGNLSASSSSGADLNLNDLIAEALNLSASSGADLRASGACSDLVADASSGADLHAQTLTCVRGDISASSGASLQANLSGAVEANASSGASISVFGTPVENQVSQSSGGSVRLRD